MPLHGLVAPNPIFFLLAELLQIEAVMLASAIIVCLAGLMFSSERFSGAFASFYATEYDGLVRHISSHVCLYFSNVVSPCASTSHSLLQAGAVIFVVSVTIAYYGFMFIVDLLLVLKWVPAFEYLMPPFDEADIMAPSLSQARRCPESLFDLQEHG